MKMSLVKKLSMGFILVILGSIILASTISNYTVGNKFKNYLVDEQKTKIDNVLKIIDDLYSGQKESSEINTDEIQRYAELQDLYIEIKDIHDNTLYSSGKSYLQKNGMMGNMMGSMMNNSYGINMGEYTENKYPLVSNNKEEVGTIIIGYFGTSYLSSASVSFISTLNHSFIVSALVALIFGIIISIVMSKQISKPLAQITETANKMRNGDLNVRAKVNSNTKEIVELSNSINYLSQTLSNQEMLRKRLTSDMAHELRTPLTTLKTHVEAFIDGIWEPTNERFETFYNEIDRLTKMVNNLRDLAKFEQININLNKSKVNLSNELGKVVDTYEPLYIKKNYELTSIITPEIKANIDIDKFKQIMNNLLSNSYKHLRSNGKVKVVLKKENNSIIIKIIDNGIGIPDKDIPYIFERFYRSDLSRNKNTGGSGIGLTITKAFVEAHGGKIYLESTVNKGTTFTLEFPNIF
ncbi:sensor histidine kinase [Clostridium saccharobutylicum]|uniref:histidine kinase n=1 Tax=Clostridium saccharobutylicum DSM 13864 TaxID=1345695 RepID=U5MRR8_CLOSA|nr:HAMP domain-containing sensor histidine kinase [Clostridium saccharobutylicum]AGX43305.1 signal transduction histidine-protein kinase BaeS [Clostridium saccharobutylicum DSM 13864]AQR90605.1 sensor histidine kinase YycG [Clostridium saccharobutylicum]AQS00509.1 sensor histidine kinase YycG [Clostridium saccharobutylicum]AQS10160.1 sensor histidine kinase YycG [Clostridium saccharobutylicum]AQS14492.1 sensor histidine kinase YycG [Clostridium saccharobutylicum]